MLTVTATMVAFAGVYALLGTMLSENRGAIVDALRGGQPEESSPASRAFSRA